MHHGSLTVSQENHETANIYASTLPCAWTGTDVTDCKLCSEGNNANRVITSTKDGNNTLLLSMHSDSSVNMYAFWASYTFYDPVQIDFAGSIFEAQVSILYHRP